MNRVFMVCLRTKHQKKCFKFRIIEILVQKLFAYIYIITKNLLILQIINYRWFGYLPIYCFFTHFFLRLRYVFFCVSIYFESLNRP